MPTARTTPLVVAEPGWPIVALCPLARRYGVEVGQSVAQARLRCPTVRAVPPDRATATVLWREALDATCTISPVVEPADAVHGALYLDARGLERLWGDPATVARQAVRALAEVGVHAQAGAGPTRLVARALAELSQEDAPRWLEGPRAVSFLQRLPIDASALGLSPATTALLHDLGIHTAGTLAALPATAVGLRFGTEGLEAWHRVSGTREPPLRAWAPSPMMEEMHRDEDGIDDSLALGRVVGTLAARLAVCLCQHGQAAATLTLRLTDTTGARRIRSAQPSEAVQGEDSVAAVAHDLLAALMMTAPVSEVRLRASDLCVPAVRQPSLWGSEDAAPGHQSRRSEHLQRVLQVHAQRYGAEELRRLWRDHDAPDGWRQGAWDQPP